MTDNDIIKALECCSANDCNNCPYDKHKVCGVELSKDALDLINRQKEEKETMQEYINCLRAEVERLNKAVASSKDLVERIHQAHMEILQNAKSEAIKEFERKIKVHAYYIDFPKEHRVIDEDDIDAVLKEMTEVQG